MCSKDKYKCLPTQQQWLLSSPQAMCVRHSGSGSGSDSDSGSGIKINAENSRHMALLSWPLLIFFVINFSIGQQWWSTSVVCLWTFPFGACAIVLHFLVFRHSIVMIAFSSKCAAFNPQSKYSSMVCAILNENMCKNKQQQKKTQRLKWTLHLPTQMAGKRTQFWPVFILFASNRLVKISIEFLKHLHHGVMD